MERRTIVVVVAVAILCLAIAGCRGKTTASQSPYVIGAIFDSTGPASPLGTPERETVQMIADEIEETGGINGRPVKFVILDNGSEETKCVMAAKKLIESENVIAIIGPSQTGTTLAIASICEKAGIPLVSCAAGVNIVDPVKPYVFKTAQSDTHAVAKVLDYLNSEGIKKVAFINVANAFGASGRQQMENQAGGAHIQIIAKEEFGDKDTDITAQLTRINAKKPGAVVCWGTNPGPAIVARNMQQLGMRVPLIMSHGVANRKFIELAGDAAEGVVFPAGRLLVAGSIPDSDPQKQTLLAYSEQFNKTYNKNADTFGGHAWDAARLVLNALEKAGDDPAKIREELERTRNFVGISGVFNFSPTDHNGLSKSAFSMVRIKNGEWEMLN